MFIISFFKTSVSSPLGAQWCDFYFCVGSTLKTKVWIRRSYLTVPLIGHSLMSRSVPLHVIGKSNRQKHICEDVNIIIVDSWRLDSVLTSHTHTYAMLQDIPQQMNGSDCGMFACKFAEYVSRGAPVTFSQVHVPSTCTSSPTVSLTVLWHSVDC